MSLKAFHVFFIFCAILLVGGLGIWQLEAYGQARAFFPLLTGVSFLAGAVGLVVYLVWFLKKMKKTN